MEQTTPRGPRRLTPLEIKHERAVRKVQRKIKRTQFKAQTAAEIKLRFPHMVEVAKSRFQSEDSKLELRRWLIEQGMRMYHTFSDASDKADITWDKNWREFRFAKSEHSVMFTMCFRR